MSSNFTLRFPLYPLEESASPTTCLVTGATGYVAGALVERLLAAGHIVHGTVRVSGLKNTTHLTSLPGASERFKLFVADLLEPNSFEEAMHGCKYVFHVASPYILGVGGKHAEEKLIRPAISGVEAVLGAASRTESVEVVVMTSSYFAMVGDNWERGEDHVLTEEDWNVSATPTYLTYHYSKVVAERKAWEMYTNQTGTNKWKLVVINPGMILGPPLGENLLLRK